MSEKSKASLDKTIHHKQTKKKKKPSLSQLTQTPPVQSSPPTDQPTPSTRKRKRPPLHYHASPSDQPSTTHSQPHTATLFKKKKKKRKKNNNHVTVTPSPHPVPPHLTPPASDNTRNSAITQTTIQSTATSQPSPPISPLSTNSIRNPENPVTPSKTPARKSVNRVRVKSSVPPKSTNFTAPPSIPSSSFGHDPRDQSSEMPRYHNHHHPENTWFHVGTDHHQPRARIQRRNPLERTYPNAHHQPNLPHAPPYPLQGNRSAPPFSHPYPYYERNTNRPTWPHHSANPHFGPSHHQKVPQYHAYREPSHHPSPQNRCQPQQPSPNPNVTQTHRLAEQPSNTYNNNSTQNTPRDYNQPSTYGMHQPPMLQSDHRNRQMGSTASARNAHLRSTGADVSALPTTRQPPSSTKALRKSVQDKTASPTGEYYGIRYGRDGFSGVATCWKSCSVFVVGYRDAVYELFDTWEKAERFSDRYGTGASVTHRSNFRHFFGSKRNGIIQKGSTAQLPWEHENEPQVVSLIVGAAWLRFGIGSGIGGYGVFLSLNNPYNCAGLMEGNVTELRLQLKGLLEALEIVHQHRLVKDGGTVELYTASQEVKNGIDHWLGRWDRSGQWVRDGKPVGSQDLWKAILNIRKELLKKGTRIHMICVRRPSKVPALEHAVGLARGVLDSRTTDNGQKKRA